ncbi:MAG TPA: NAD-dependent epimerase/dehydratase family protein, partial [Caulifigura sp.]|nr:NAD-dependent epimerase/dehydratase family protein [Caulifigura sp.]
HWLFECDHIFHLAAVYKAGGWPATHPATQFHANMAMNINVLECWKRYFPKARFTSVVSYCMYPEGDQAHPESELYGTEPEPYLFAYAFTKKALLIGQNAYCREFGLSATSAVLSTVYGPGDSYLETSHVMGALIGKFSRAAREGLPEVEVWGDGTQEREFLFVEDAVEGILCAAEEAKSPVLNLGVGSTATVRQIAETIAGIVGFKGTIRYNTDRFVGAKRRYLDVTLARNELTWRPRTDLTDGIRKTVEGLKQ